MTFFTEGMKITVPMAVTDSIFDTSNLAEDESRSAWSSVTTYALNDEVYVASTHKRYKATQGSNTNHNPVGDDGTWWVEVSWTNRWRALTTDSSAATVAEDSSGITYTLTADGTYDTVGFVGLKTASVTVTIKTGGGSTVSTETKAQTETVNGLSFFVGVAVFPGLDIQSGYDIEITIADTGLTATAEVAKIVVGYTHEMGTAAAGINSTFDDLSDKEQDEFGRFNVTARGFSDVIEYTFAHALTRTRWAQAVLMWLRVTPCLYWVSEADLAKGLFIFGFASEPRTTLGVNTSTTTMTVVGLALGGSVAIADIPGGAGPAPAAAPSVGDLVADLAWDPSDTSSMFQDSAGTTAITTDGQSVGLMKDVKSDTWHASQAASTKPIWKDDGTYQWVDSSGSSQWLGLGWYQTDNDQSMCFGIELDSSASFPVVMADAAVAGLGVGMLFLGATYRAGVQGSGYNNSAGTTIALNTGKVFTIQWDKSAQLLYFYVDGVQVGTTVATSASALTANTAMRLFTGYGSFTMDGRIYRAAAYNGFWSAGERADVEAWVADNTPDVSLP